MRLLDLNPRVVSCSACLLCPQEFGDLTKSAVKAFTGKDTYEFGDVTKKVGQMLFGNKQVKKKDQKEQ